MKNEYVLEPFDLDKPYLDNFCEDDGESINLGKFLKAVYGNINFTHGPNPSDIIFMIEEDENEEDELESNIKVMIRREKTPKEKITDLISGLSDKESAKAVELLSSFFKEI